MFGLFCFARARLNPRQNSLREKRDSNTMKYTKLFAAVAVTAVSSLTVSGAQGVFDFETIPSGAPAPVSTQTGDAAGWTDNVGATYSSVSNDGSIYGHLNTSGTYWGGVIANSKTNTGTTFTGDVDTYRGGAASGDNYGVICGDSRGNLGADDPYFPNAYKTNLNEDGYGYSTSFMTDEAVVFNSIDISMTAYTYKSLFNPDANSNVGVSGQDPDTFEKTYYSINNTEGSFYACRIYALDENYEPITSNYKQVIFAQNIDGTVTATPDWTTVDLGDLCGEGAYGLAFEMISNFGNNYGMLTPSYVAIDNLVFTTVPEPAVFAALFGAIAMAFAAYKRRK